MVEHQRSIPRTSRAKFVVVHVLDGSWLSHLSAYPFKMNVFGGDVEALANEGLLSPSFEGSGVRYDISPSGYRYYEEALRRKGEPVTRVSGAIRTYIDGGVFLSMHPKSYSKWVEAEDMLWGDDSEKRLTTIGHLCREALQAFATELVERFQPPTVDHDLAHDVARIRAVLEHRSASIGLTEGSFLDALLGYWGTVSDLAQRQTHGAQREQEALTWADARRLVFQSLVVMHEVSRSLEV